MQESKQIYVALFGKLC